MQAIVFIMCPSPMSSFPIVRHGLVLMAALLALGGSGSAAAADPEVLLVIRDHRFEPAEVKVPANQRIKLVVHNQDNSAEEFESQTLNREKVIPAQAKITLFIGPLKPGRYAFVGEYHEATAKGVVVAE
jgi:plastocyanin